MRIPVCRPLLPSASEIAPYLSSIDDARWYSNFGPLYRRLASRLADTAGVLPGQVTVVANATLGLSLSLMAVGASGGLCMMPAWTFAASPASALHAGVVPWFVDIDRESWALTPEAAERELRNAPGRVSAVMPVSPFGGPVPTAAWDAFSDRTGIPVVIDAAAAFDAFEPGTSPCVVSFHATKAFGIGEGGGVYCRRMEIAEKVQQLANLGLREGRVAAVAGTNAKLSEYGCAVGLAALDRWSADRARWLDLAGQYVSGLQDLVGFPPGYGRFATATCTVWCDQLPAEALADELAGSGIGTLRWWQTPCPDHPAFTGCPVGKVENARHAAAHTLGLPMSLSMSDGEVAEVVAAVRRSLAGRAPSRRRAAE